MLEVPLIKNKLNHDDDLQVVVQRKIPDFTGLEHRIGSFVEVLETCFRFEPTSRPTADEVLMVRALIAQERIHAQIHCHNHISLKSEVRLHPELRILALTF